MNGALVIDTCASKAIIWGVLVMERYPMPLRRFSLVLPLSLLLVAKAPVAAQTTTIDFDDQACTGSSFATFGSPLITGGFTFTSIPSDFDFGSWCDGAPFWDGSALFNNTVGATTQLALTGGGLFSIQSIDLASIFLAQSLTVGFTGFHADATTVFQQFLVGAGGFSTFSFSPDFQNLVALEWVQADPFHQFDTVVLASEAVVIPEPSTVVLTLTGLLGIAAAARIRRRRKSA